MATASILVRAALPFVIASAVASAGCGDDSDTAGSESVASSGAGTGGTSSVGSGNGPGGGGSSPSSSSTGSGGAPPTGWPDATNTGYEHAPGYPGQLTRCSEPIQSNMTYEFCDFPDGLGVGSSGDHPTNVTFVGCRFASNALEDANVAVYGDGITFSYCTFEPSAVAAPPTAYDDGYQYGIDQRYDGKLSVDHCDFWGWGNGIQFGSSNQAKPVTVRDSWFHDSRDDGGVDHTDAILENYGGQSYMVFDHNTIVAVGNTNGLALQGSDYDHVTVTNNYFSGFGYTLNLGGHGPVTNLVFTGNTYGTDLHPGYGPLYDWSSEEGQNNSWKMNKWAVPSGAAWGMPAHDGWYWLPVAADTHGGQDDSEFVSETDYDGP